MSLENRLHLQCEDPDLLIEFDLPPGTHATIGASPQSEITFPLTGIPPFLCILGRFQDGRVFIADLDGSVNRSVYLPDTLSFPPYQFVLFHPDEPETDPETELQPETGQEPVTDTNLDGNPTSGKSREQIASRIRSLFRKRPEPAKPEEREPGDS